MLRRSRVVAWNTLDPHDGLPECFECIFATVDPYCDPLADATGPGDEHIAVRISQYAKSGRSEEAVIYCAQSPRAENNEVDFLFTSEGDQFDVSSAPHGGFHGLVRPVRGLI